MSGDKSDLDIDNQSEDGEIKKSPKDMDYRYRCVVCMILENVAYFEVKPAHFDSGRGNNYTCHLFRCDTNSHHLTINNPYFSDFYYIKERGSERESDESWDFI